MVTEVEFKRVRWASRRGMLELDLIMVPFVEERFRDLNPLDQQRFIDLLDSEDTDLFAWFLGRKTPPDAELAAIVSQVIEYSRGH